MMYKNVNVQQKKKKKGENKSSQICKEWNIAFYYKLLKQLNWKADLRHETW